MKTPTIFISYRRNDCPGYAGRLEDALERIYGRGSVFRDVHDIAAGEDFAAVIESSLQGVRAGLVLIGPEWFGVRADGTRRIDEAHDFVRLEVSTVLKRTCKVVPVLLAGAKMPNATELPQELRTLADKQALSLSETDWDTDLLRLVRSLGFATAARKRAIAVAAGLALLVAGASAAYFAKPSDAPIKAAAATAADELLGSWQTSVKYYWGDTYQEEFVFKRFAGELTGTASYLKYPRGIEDLTVTGNNVHFVTHTVESVNEQDRTLTHHYQAELDGNVLRIRMQTTGGFTSVQPQEFTAMRATDMKQQPK